MNLIKFQLKKANSEQIKRIKKFIKNYQDLAFAGFEINKYKSEIITNSDKSNSIHHNKNKNEWKYFILEHERKNNSLNRLQEILFLSSLGLTLVFESFKSESLIRTEVNLYHTQKIINFYYNESTSTSVKVITEKHSW